MPVGIFRYDIERDKKARLFHEHSCLERERVKSFNVMIVFPRRSLAKEKETISAGIKD